MKNLINISEPEENEEENRSVLLKVRIANFHFADTVAESVPSTKNKY